MLDDTVVSSKTILVDNLETHYLEAGSGSPLVLVHGGEFGGCAELCWEHNIAELAKHHHVIAPDLLGFGKSAKVHDFVLGTRRMLLHLSRLCEELGLSEAAFVGNSFAGGLLLADAATDSPVLPASRLVSVCGGGRAQPGEHLDALLGYDGSIEAMEQVLVALFHSDTWHTDREYLERRHLFSLEPGAWEATASARFRRPNAEPKAASQPRSYAGVTAPTLFIEGQRDKLKPAGWAAEAAEPIPGARVVVMDDVGHCPQIERPDDFNKVLLDFLHS